MNILIVAQHFPVCSARYAADAFTRLGHTVRHVGQPMGRNIWGMQVPDQYVWTPDAVAFPGIDWARGTAIVVMDSDPAMLSWVLNDTGFHKFPGVPTVVWGVDNHVRDYRRPYFDHYFLAHKSVSVMDWTMRDDMTWLPCATDLHAFPPSPIPWAERQYDVCMIGVMYPQRWALVQAMRDAGLKVLAGTGLVYDAYRDAYHNSRVALVSSFNGDLPIRLFEGAGMGCAVLADEIADLALLPPSPVRTYDSIESAVLTAKALQDESWSYLGQACAEWASQHTWDIRAQVIIDWLEARS